MCTWPLVIGLHTVNILAAFSDVTCRAVIKMAPARSATAAAMAAATAGSKGSATGLSSSDDEESSVWLRSTPYVLLFSAGTPVPAGGAGIGVTVRSWAEAPVWVASLSVGSASAAAASMACAISLTHWSPNLSTLVKKRWP